MNKLTIFELAMCRCLSLVSHVKHEANIFGHSADYHHNPLSVTLLLAQSQPVSGSICQYAAWRFVSHHQVLLGVASTTLHFSSLFHPSFHFAFFSGLINCAERPVIMLFHVVGILSQSKRLPFVCVFCCHLSQDRFKYSLGPHTQMK